MAVVVDFPEEPARQTSGVTGVDSVSAVADSSLGSEDLAGLPNDVLGARICGLASRMAQATYYWLVMIAEFDARGGWAGVGIKSCAHWLAWRCSLSPGAAREHVRVARALRSLPLVSAEMSAGRLSYAKVREITRMTSRPADESGRGVGEMAQPDSAAHDADPDTDRQNAAQQGVDQQCVDQQKGDDPTVRAATGIDETALVALARAATASQLARSVRAFRRAAGVRGHQERTRSVAWYTADDGSVVLTARLPAEEGAAVLAALEAARDDLHRKAGSVTEPVDRADMLVHLARGYLTATPEDRSGEDRTLVVVHVDARHLDHSEAEDSAADSAAEACGDAGGDVGVGLCRIDGVGGIEPDTARRLACDAMLVGIIQGAGGVTLAHGRRRRLVSAAQRRALQVRDGGCRFPGCERVTHLEAHHVTPWSHSGPTNLPNLILLCRFHHVACDEGGVRIRERATSTRRRPDWIFVTAQGEPFAAQPAAPGWRDDDWILWQGLDGSKGRRDAEADKICPLWAGERFSLADTVSVLFGITSGRDRDSGRARRAA